jgi:ubiquinone/menaquinone biosynthesis C-methylase UbiE
MKQNFIQQFFSKIIAKQLRKPRGILAGKFGTEMNKTNGSLYDFTLDSMQLNDNESVLEIGFGNGKFFDKIFSAANNLTVSGIDFSPEMVKEAIASNTKNTTAGRLNLRFGSSDNIPFADNSFDRVFCINVIYFWEQPADHLKEIYRVLKPGGKFYTSIRTKETMMQMPFTNYGFTIYEQDEWIAELKTNHLHFLDAKKTENEPGAMLKKQLVKVESLCIVTKK